jgi:AraC-like DNA-binding protein
VDYREYPSPAGLRDQVECLWRLRQPRPTGSVQTIYPDGRCELIVHLATPPRCWDPASGWHAQARTLFAGQRLTAVRLESGGPLDCVGVRLRPAASNLWHRRAATHHHGRIVDLATIDATFSRSLARAARRAAGGSAGALWSLLAARLVASPDPRMVAAVESLERQAGRPRIEALARAAALSMRGFQLRFRAAVGLAPKQFARLMRLQATLRALDAGDARITDLASDGGFADQAHATRELRRVTGLAPARLRAALRRDRDGDAAVRLAAAFVRGQAG